jgi:predicted DNA-binding transcriptional regulator
MRKHRQWLRRGGEPGLQHKLPRQDDRGGLPRLQGGHDEGGLETDICAYAWLTPYTEWAYRLPILAAAYLMLLIILWIGYTMATTPPPIPLENPLDLESEREEKKEDKSP